MHGSFLRALRWDAYDVVDDRRAVRVFFVQAGTARGPHHPIDRVELTETSTHIVVTLYERDRGGGTKMMGVHGCVEVPLRDPVDSRKVVDGLTGGRRRQRNLDDTDAYHRWRSRAAENCQRWNRPSRHGDATH